MKKSHFVIAIAACLMLSAFEAAGQETTMVNVNIGGGAGQLTEIISGSVTTTYSDGSKETNKIGYDLNYQIMPVAFLDVEYVTGRFITMFEGMYEKAIFNDYKEYTNPEFLLLDPASFGDANMYTASGYIGVNGFHGKRFQMPIMGGVAVKYFDHAPIKSAYVDFVYKVRARFYLTNTIALFAGVSGSYGGTKLEEELDNLAPESHMFDLAAKRIHAEAGLTITVGRK